uniref:Uncharacterized protein n=1 Tax=Aegilops tauschii subsp. strangulata TaxID=200361 RepID=A0A453ALY8_AEGTS
MAALLRPPTAALASGPRPGLPIHLLPPARCPLASSASVPPLRWMHPPRRRQLPPQTLLRPWPPAPRAQGVRPGRRLIERNVVQAWAHGKSGDLRQRGKCLQECRSGTWRCLGAQWSTRRLCVQGSEFDKALRTFDRIMGGGFQVRCTGAGVSWCGREGLMGPSVSANGGVAGRQRDGMVEAAPVDMYCKCGCVEEAWCVTAFAAVNCAVEFSDQIACNEWPW